MALLEARDFNGLRSTLGDLKFVQAKCMAGMGYELLAEATKAVGCSISEDVDPKVINSLKLKYVVLVVWFFTISSFLASRSTKSGTACKVQVCKRTCLDGLFP